MEKLYIKDKDFVKSISHNRILESVKRVADELNRDYKGDNPVFVGVLNGAFMFAADLLKDFQEHCELTFITVASYVGTKSSGEVDIMMGLTKDIKDRRVILLEDIVDSGTTIDSLIKELAKYEPKDVKVATLLLKPDALETNVKPDYVGIEIPNDFIVGYGLDYDGYGRNFKDIYKLSND